jgi:hypothetical protein
MKKQNFSAILKRSFFSAVLTGSLIAGLSSAASAQEKINSPDPSIKYIGSLDGKPIFKVDLDNQEGKLYYLAIKDDQGSVLYSEKIRDKQFSKNFQFDGAGQNNVKLTFVLSADKETQSKEFKVNTSTRVYNDVVVTTL